MKEIIFLTDFKQNSFDISNKSKSRDFLYGTDMLKDNYKFKTFDIGKLRISKNIFIKFISKLSFIFIGVYGTINIQVYNFFKRIPNESNVICANDGIGFCCLIMKYLLRKKFKIYILSMGFFSKYFYYNKNLFFYFPKKFLINFLLKKCCKILFLGEEELIFFQNLFKRHNSKAKLFRFRIDNVFWKKNFHIKKELNPYILFIGNDLMRDYSMVYKIAKSLPNIQFKIISERFRKIYPKKLKNITNFGFNKNQYYELSDEQLRIIIQEAKCLLLPIKNTLQPSGQSVSLQALACKTPLIINNYKGFWGREDFKHLHNCFLLKQNAKDEDWVKIIDIIFDETKDFHYLTNNGYIELIEKYPYEDYLAQWMKIINDN